MSRNSLGLRLMGLALVMVASSLIRAGVILQTLFVDNLERNAAPVPEHLKCIFVVVSAFAGWARCVNAWHEKELNAYKAFALARITTSFRYIEREPSGVVSAPARIGSGREEFADMVEEAGIGRKVRARRAPNRLLVDLYQTLNGIHVTREMATRCLYSVGRVLKITGRCIILWLITKMQTHKFRHGLRHKAGFA